MKYKSALFLLAANFLPVLGVVYFDWSLFSIFFLFWAENIAIGLFNVLRMFTSKAESPNKRYKMKVNGKPRLVSRASLVGFFILHYGFFTLGHGVAVFSIFGPSVIQIKTLVFAIAALFVSHGVSYATNFIGNGECKKIPVGKLLIQPYKRVVIMHFIVLIGGIFISSTGTSMTTLIMFIALKSVTDLVSHLIEHQKIKVTYA
ncbi:MAG: hypothetical protein A2653_00125 [Candidatus Zambryskibacteria bacterium RIFCSPHIGHO2_01_FULL_43_25]|uniref:Uncharacterized protein n=1 Tax=Candidatus Zambryskibacteria bacterium RIFCSPLOWO2_01_FULL_45_21 TaxID=1802761 RepID=A0A1G2U150_9BACT|nr:MAG: hypothetical protein A2653_00125 [Candidatus Zambryskibacteria bacterium RIFCSPHIGHO2_01_FULL_43_25]OHB00132.1 MAG: hypothetical protein A3E94_00260 [Candidatus Zambryskibacteria bacterium RIFCSPHIGHO2_12_FULL_44_12b]OHB03251.1 MAG: hypothetical protein A3B14_00545 [Candidatus Zambryskibacteria bacterium RIFCSPLOWO2_01_FULL_45_21]